MNSSRSRIRHRAAAAAVAAAATVLAACGSGGDPATDQHDHPAGTSAHEHGHGATAAPTSVVPNANSADVAFASMMIPHHQQAVDMAGLVPSRTQNAWLIDFARQVTATQGREIQQLETALSSWGQPVPADTGHDMDGMMTPEQMAHLESLSGDAFDREWITMMIAHHRGAVAMAQTEIEQGQNGQMRALAQQIITAQQAEISQLQAQLNE